MSTKFYSEIEVKYRDKSIKILSNESSYQIQLKEGITFVLELTHPTSRNISTNLNDESLKRNKDKNIIQSVYEYLRELINEF